MRRKNLMITVGFILILALLHSAGFPLARSALEGQVDVDRVEPYLIIGKVVGLEERQQGGFHLEIAVESIDGISVKKQETILVTCPNLDEKPGDLFRRKIHLQGVFRLPEEQRNPGCFDYRLYLKSRGIWFLMNADSLQLDTDRRNPVEQLEAWLISQRFAFRDTLSQQSRGLICGILFGDTSDLEESVYDQFRANGTAHILAVSGLHLGILYGLYRKLAGKKKKLSAAILLGLLLFAYGTVSMWNPSVQRAAMMIGLSVLARFLDLRYDMVTGLSTVAMILILQNPYVIFGAGFQMSFLAVASICFFRPVMPGKIPDSLAAMAAVQLGLMLYQMYQFNYVSLVSLAANFPIVFLTGILVPVALICFLFFLIAGGAGPLMVVMDSLSHLLLEINRLSSLGGHGSLDVVSPPPWMVIGAYLLLFFFTSETCHVLWLRGRKADIAKSAVSCMLLGALCGMLLTSPVSRADLVFVDVGQGDCIHIRDGNQSILIDGGGSVTYNVGKEILKPYLLKNGVHDVDLAIATHLHTDHYQGLVELSEVYTVKKLVSGLVTGDQIKVSDQVTIETLWPLEIDPEIGQEENSQCSVFLIHYGSWRILDTGDLDEEGEREMVSYYKEKGLADRLRADILKIGHHGSQTSTCDEFLDAVDPQAAVIQVGAYNLYGHPSPKIIEKLQQRGIIVKRNDMHGAIGLLFGEEDYRIVTVISEME